MWCSTNCQLALVSTAQQTLLMLQAFKCDQGSWEGLEALIKQLPSIPDAVISNAALGSATVEQYEPDPHKQDLAMIQVGLIFQHT